MGPVSGKVPPERADARARVRAGAPSRAFCGASRVGYGVTYGRRQPACPLNVNAGGHPAACAAARPGAAALQHTAMPNIRDPSPFMPRICLKRPAIPPARRSRLLALHGGGCGCRACGRTRCPSVYGACHPPGGGAALPVQAAGNERPGDHPARRVPGGRPLHGGCVAPFPGGRYTPHSGTNRAATSRRLPPRSRLRPPFRRVDSPGRVMASPHTPSFGGFLRPASAPVRLAVLKIADAGFPTRRPSLLVEPATTMLIYRTTTQ